MQTLVDQAERRAGAAAGRNQRDGAARPAAPAQSGRRIARRAQYGAATGRIEKSARGCDTARNGRGKARQRVGGEHDAAVVGDHGRVECIGGRVQRADRVREVAPRHRRGKWLAAALRERSHACDDAKLVQAVSQLI